jgi:hypothetical protein
MAELNIMPAWQAERVSGKFTRDVTRIVEDVRVINGANGERKIITRTLKKDKEEFTEAVMLWFPQGHSMLIAADDHEQLIRLGVMADPKLVDMESGEIAPPSYHMTPKDVVEASQNVRRRNTTTIGGLTQLLEEASHG